MHKKEEITDNQLKQCIKVIKRLANGDWASDYTHSVSGTPDGVNLLKARFSGADRILWQRAKSFSPEDSKEIDVYVETIRIWAIIVDHDKQDRVIERICKCILRGEECKLKKCVQSNFLCMKESIFFFSLSHFLNIYYNWNLLSFITRVANYDRFRLKKAQILRNFQRNLL